ncbi:MAG: sensor histidine kinase [Actinomycetales bacterium]
MGTTLLGRLGRDTAYTLLGFPLAVIAFVVVVTGLSLSAGLLVTLLGIPVAVATLAAARGLALVERARLRTLDDRPLPLSGPVVRRGRGLRGWLAPLGDAESWLAVLHAVLGFPVAIVTFVVTVVWWAMPLGGLTYWFWSRYLPENRVDDDQLSLAELIGWGPDDDVWLYTGTGLLFLLTLPPMMRLLAASQAALARLLVANSEVARLRQRVDTLETSRAAVVEAGTTTLQRLERDLHDGPQARLVRLQMDLASAERRLADDPQAARTLVVGAQTQVDEALSELRNLSRGIAPPILVDRGLSAALSALAARAAVQVRLDVRLPDGSRLPSPVESTAYYVVAEALTNVAKHSRATRCEVGVATAPGPGQDGSVPDEVRAAVRAVRVEVRDDGVGGASLAKGHGLAGLADRVSAVDGTLTVDSPAGGPTVLVAEIPVR